MTYSDGNVGKMREFDPEERDGHHDPVFIDVPESMTLGDTLTAANIQNGTLLLSRLECGRISKHVNIPTIEMGK